ncbi:GTP-binding protein Era [Serratia rubidaea]|uniref:GTPase Era n=1 Tax=Serratia rubidaea TaxID=61652 RepID=A0A447QHT2_SERRU|nr:GTP-binding protein Era [Serratia rubidaea]
MVGTGSSRRKAEQAAAEQALKSWSLNERRNTILRIYRDRWASNVGKSTLLNQLLGKKSPLPRVSRRPRVTALWVSTPNGPYQAIYVDTPGLHIEEKRAINRLMNRAASSSIGDVELVIFVVEGTNWTDDDEMVLNKLRSLKCPVLLAINKVDNVTDKSKLLPHIAFLSQQMNFLDVVPISAEKGMNVDTIAGIVRKLLPEAEHHFRKITSPIVPSVLWLRKSSVKN